MVFEMFRREFSPKALEMITEFIAVKFILPLEMPALIITPFQSEGAEDISCTPVSTPSYSGHRVAN
jgi:hypothetical protein